MEPEQSGDGPQQDCRGSHRASTASSCSPMGLQPASIPTHPASPGVSDLVHNILFLAGLVMAEVCLQEREEEG